MKTIFDESNREDLIHRISTINENCSAEWGKMNVFQMLRHCTIWEEWIQGRNQYTYKQEFIGFLFGKWALNSILKDDKPFDRNVPTSEQFKVKETAGDIETEKQKWIALLHEYGHYSNPDFIHDFFGKMTKEQIGRLAYKHTDHHLRQFGC